MQVGRCGLEVEDEAAVRKYGVCINDRFPETRSLNLGQTLSSGHGSVSFDSDRDCTQFVHSFFPACRRYLSSCSQVVLAPAGCD
jgi:hypothetical protein